MENIWLAGIVIVAAAGNRGPNLMTLSPIGECASCICVGCHDGDYKGKGSRLCNEYSSRGPGRDLNNKSVKKTGYRGAGNGYCFLQQQIYPFALHSKKRYLHVRANRERRMCPVPAEISVSE